MEVPRHWRLKKQRYALVGNQCPVCEEKIFPPRDICPRCGGKKTIINNEEGAIKAELPVKLPQLR